MPRPRPADLAPRIFKGDPDQETLLLAANIILLTIKICEQDINDFKLVARKNSHNPSTNPSPIAKVTDYQNALAFAVKIAQDINKILKKENTEPAQTSEVKQNQSGAALDYVRCKILNAESSTSIILNSALSRIDLNSLSIDRQDNSGSVPSPFKMDM